MRGASSAAIRLKLPPYSNKFNFMEIIATFN